MRLFVVVLFLSLFTGCFVDGKKPANVDGPEPDMVVFLFEVDGVKVYRFYDGGKAHYIGISQGNVVPVQTPDT